jgi:prepilin-type N-terminal cleavage/methylation domain-containing protein
MRYVYGVSRGFTLIEILLVFSIVSILSVATVFAYSSFNTKQQLNNSSQDVLILIHTAKAKAQAQISPSLCTSLMSYQVMRCGAGPVCKTPGADATTYELQAVCSSGSYAVDTKTLAPNVTFDSSSATTVSFNVLTGGANAGAFIIKNGSNTRTITISSYGQITLTQN